MGSSRDNRRSSWAVGNRSRGSAIQRSKSFANVFPGKKRDSRRSTTRTARSSLVARRATSCYDDDDHVGFDKRVTQDFPPDLYSEANSAAYDAFGAPVDQHPGGDSICTVDMESQEKEKDDKKSKEDNTPCCGNAVVSLIFMTIIALMLGASTIYLITKGGSGGKGDSPRVLELMDEKDHLEKKFTEEIASLKEQIASLEENKLNEGPAMPTEDEKLNPEDSEAYRELEQKLKDMESELKEVQADANKNLKEAVKKVTDKLKAGFEKEKKDLQKSHRDEIEKLRTETAKQMSKSMGTPNKESRPTPLKSTTMNRRQSFGQGHSFPNHGHGAFSRPEAHQPALGEARQPALGQGMEQSYPQRQQSFME